ncbi:hypothetical protein [Burkholderia sp. Ac-20365]|uniref:hypothetical protein n=1 Tax=Burkholderia sp. Ac-20365 TaxID=2703897 RepID=UPI00197C470F|nr:hypothetical protein [Burkholderia sp. Ac-20365]MBN3761162.1 hypothetical protein [Burkholderia sp. Ac-20365]
MAIGDITVSFTMLESVVQSLVHTLLGLKATKGQAVTAELSFKNLRALAASLYIERHGAGPKTVDFAKLIQRIRSVEEQRNQITHSVWAGNDAGQIVRIKTTAKEGRGVEMKHHEVTVSDLTKISTEIKRLASEVQSIRLRLAATPTQIEQ